MTTIITANTEANARSVTRATRKYQSAPEWYTPGWLLTRLAAFLGDGWYDPCPASFGRVGRQENGLATSWAKRRVYVNPPYGADITPWIRKAVTEPVREIILLVPAYTDTRWFAPLYEASQAILFVRGRLRFERPQSDDGDAQAKSEPAPHPSVMVYRGYRWRRFAEAFRDLGPVLRVAVPMLRPSPDVLLLPPAPPSTPRRGRRPARIAPVGQWSEIAPLLDVR